MNIRILTLVFGLSFGLVTSEAWALFGSGNSNKLEKRIANLEQMLQSSNQGDLMMQLERLQREIQQLRGELEIQGHALDAMKRRQNDLYTDIDQRLRTLSGEAPAASKAGGAAQPGGVPPLQLNTSSTQTPAGGMGGASSSAQATLQNQAPDPHQEAAYQASFEQLKKGEYQSATESFKSFLSAYPRGPFADKAQYWLAEAFYVMQDYNASLAEFDKLVKNYPYSPKVADSLLKMSYIQSEKKNWTEARSLLAKITQEHSGSGAAAQATKRLDLLRQKGH